MRSTRQLRPAHSPRRRTITSAAIAIGAIVGTLSLTGLTTAAASADERPSTTVATTSFTASVKTVQAEPLRDVRAEARSTLAAATSAIAAATTVTADIAASGLDVGVADTIVDTSDLREQTTRLSSIETLPLLFLPGLADMTAADTATVTTQTADLREHFDAALAKRAAEEAAAKAQREAEAAAAAAAAAAQAAAAANTPAGAKAAAAQIASAEYGWGSGQFSCLVSLWNRESGWNYKAYNAGSGATGIPQALPGSKMASVGNDWQTNATTQIRWGLRYIAGSYGSPCAAWGHSNATGWY